MIFVVEITREEAFEQAQIAFDEAQAARMAGDYEAQVNAAFRHGEWVEMHKQLCPIII